MNLAFQVKNVFKIFIGIFLCITQFYPIALLAEVKPIKEVFAPPAPKNPNDFAKVAVIQWHSLTPTLVGVSKDKAEKIKQSNREEVAEYIREAASEGAKLIITPEFGILGYPDIPELPDDEDNFRNRIDVEPYMEDVNGPTTKYFSKLSKELGVYIHVGFAEKDSRNRYYNTVAVLGPKGELVTSFRKMNLYQIENNFLSEGSKSVYYDSPFGKVGIAICADIYSSPPMDEYKENAVDVVALSTSWAQYNTGMNHFKNAAKRGNFYVLAANQHYYPDSGVINPDGSTQSHIRQTSGIAYGYLPLKK